MRVLIKSGDKIINVYWIEFRNSSVVGWLGGKWLMKYLDILPGSKVDYHFTYPKDGNLHYSLKIKSLQSEAFIKVTHNQVKIKIINENKEKYLEEGPREKYKDLLAPFIPPYKPKSFSEIKTEKSWFFFSTIGLQINNGKIDISDGENVKDYKFKKGYIFVDAEKYSTEIMNVSACLQSGVATPPLKFQDSEYEEVKEERDELRVILFMSHKKVVNLQKGD